MSLAMKCLQLSFIQTVLWVLHCLHKLMISSVNMYVNVCVFGELQSGCFSIIYLVFINILNLFLIYL